MDRTELITNLLREHTNLILTITTNHFETLAWLRENQLLPSIHRCCNQANLPMVNNGRIDGQYFRCSVCSSQYNVRIGTIWERLRRIPLVLLTRLAFYYFVNRINARETTKQIKEMGINDI